MPVRERKSDKGGVRTFLYDLIENWLYSSPITKVQRVLHNLDVRCMCE